VRRFRRGAYVRVITPGDPRMQTAHLRTIDWNSSTPFELEHWMNPGVFEWVADALDTEPEHFELLAPNLTATRIVGLAPRDSFDTFAFSCITVRATPRRPGTQGEDRTLDDKHGQTRF